MVLFLNASQQMGQVGSCGAHEPSEREREPDEVFNKSRGTRFAMNDDACGERARLSPK